MSVGWSDADELSDRIVDIMQSKRESGVSPVQLLAGLLLAYLALERTMPEKQPDSVSQLTYAVRCCLTEMLKLEEKGT